VQRKHGRRRRRRRRRNEIFGSVAGYTLYDYKTSEEIIKELNIYS
jgi:hypothetical protein